MIPGSRILRRGPGGVSGAFLPFSRGNNKLTRRKTFARDRGVATTSSRTVSCRMAMGGVSVTMQSTTVNVKRAIEFMPKTRAGLVDDGEVPEIIDLCGGDDGAGPGRRYGGFLC